MSAGVPSGASDGNPTSLDPTSLEMEAEAARADGQAVRAAVATEFVGSPEALDAVIASLLAGGHCLLEGVPGLGKTLLARTLARVLGLHWGRVQCTPDLLPSDILGSTALSEGLDGRPGSLAFQEGPVFTHLLLVDEINRATPRTQSALLEAMQERAVTTGRVTRPLPDPFLVIATENPVEMEGTYPLPEAELDRFLVKVNLAPPDRETLEEVVRRTTGADNPVAETVLDVDRVRALRAAVRRVHLPAAVLRWIADVVLATRPGQSGAPEIVNRFVRWGAGPRGAQALALLARAEALLDGRWSVSPADARVHAMAALRHRILLGFEAEAEGIGSDPILEQVLGSVADA